MSSEAHPTPGASHEVSDPGDPGEDATTPAPVDEVKEGRLRRLFLPLRGALEGVVFAAMLWSLMDWAQASAPEVPSGELWAMSATGCLMVALIAWAPGLGLLALLRRVDHCVTQTARADAEPFALAVVASASGLAAGSVVLFECIQALDARALAPEIRATALAVLAPALIFGLSVGTRWTLALLARRAALTLRPLHQHLLLWSGLFGVGVGWWWYLSTQAVELFESFELGWIFASLTIVGASALGAAWLPRWRRVWVVSVPVSGLLVSLALWHLISGPPQTVKVRILIQRASVLSHVPLGWLNRATSPDVSEGPRASVIGTCDPRKPPEPLKVDGKLRQKIRQGSPDILLVTVDAFRWDRTSLGNYHRDTTPRLVEHAASAAVFERAYTPSASTRQTMRAIFSGLPPALTRELEGAPKWGLTFEESQETLASYLLAGGYHTTAIVSDWRVFNKKHGALKGFRTIDEGAIPIHKRKKPTARYKVDKIKAVLSQKRHAPRFVWTHLNELHSPYLTATVGKIFGKKPSDRYDAAMIYTDELLDDLLDFVLAPERAANTIVIIASDHGEGFMEHGHKFHGSMLYEEGVRVPWIIWGPGVKPVYHSEPRSLIDLTPTVLGFAGVPRPETLCGQDLSDGLRSDRALTPRPVYLEIIPDRSKNYYVIAYIEGRYKLIHYPELGISELFDLDDDPLEEHNLADREVGRLAQMFSRLRELYQRRGLDPETYNLP